MSHLLLLRPKSRRSNITPPQLNAQCLLHGRENLLIRCRRPPLEIRHNALCGVAFGRQILLRHLRLHLLALVRDDTADLLADRVGLDDIIASVDLGEMLAFDTGLGCLLGVSWWGRG